jgi:hypothetical protein
MSVGRHNTVSRSAAAKRRSRSRKRRKGGGGGLPQCTRRRFYAEWRRRDYWYSYAH